MYEQCCRVGVPLFLQADERACKTASMSRWKNAIQRREHRERAQPAARAKLGLLEKKKDYKQRAVAYHRKQDRLQALRLRAAFRNPDEFNFKMLKSHTQVWPALHRGC